MLFVCQNKTNIEINDSSDIDLWNIDLLDTHLLDTDISVNICLSPRHLWDVFKTYLQDGFKTSSS